MKSSAKDHQEFLENLSPHDRALWFKRAEQLHARKHLLNFTQYTKPDYKVNFHHKIICNSITDFLTNPLRNRLMIYVGPGRGKSELVSRRTPAFYLGNNPDGRIIAASYGADLSQSMNRDVQRIIDDDPYREVFPDTQLSGKNIKNTSLGNYIRTSDKFEVVNRKGYYKSAGVGQGITGMRFDLGIIDDPIKNAEEARSSRRKKQIYEWYDSTFITRGAPSNKVIIILTRWAEDDLAGRLLDDAQKNPKADQWEVLCFPEIYDEDHPWVHADDPRENGQVLWPEQYTEQEVMARKASSSSKVWASLYQQLPTPDSGNIFQRDWFRYFRDLPQIEHKAISVDCSFKDTSKSDYVAIGVWGVIGANKYLLNYVKKRLDFPNTIKELLKLISMYNDVRYVLVEDKANGSAVISTLKNKIPGMIAFQPKTSKEGRANAVAPQVEAGNVFLPDPYYPPNRTAFPWCVEGVDEFVNELVSFPYGANDDSVDMMTQFLIREGQSQGWVDEFIKGNVNNTSSKQSKEDKLTKELADMMGWDLDEDNDRYDSAYEGF